MGIEQGEDKLLECIGCGAEFYFTAGEQEFYADHELQEPKRCPRCRKTKRQRKDYIDQARHEKRQATDSRT